VWLKLTSKLLCCETKKSSLSGYLACSRDAHTRSYFFNIHENISGSFEKQSCFRNVHVSWTYVLRKVVTRWLPRFLLVDDTCRHMRRKRHGVIWTCVCTQETKRDLRRKALFWTRHTTSAASVSRMPKDIPGLGVYATWKSVLLSPNRGCENLFIYSTRSRFMWIHKE
jgi:hypothetical protein